jgi:hypothetical protein
MILGLPLPIREKELADVQVAPTSRAHEERFQGRLQSFPIYRVRLELPKYRLENGRTSAAQRDWLSKQKKPKDFFDPSKAENDEVQEAQHQILTTMAASTDKEKDLFHFFSKREQERPLILDASGFVINGNRRLATFREIHEKNPARFSHVDVIILPKCDPKDIDELEVHLQVERDIKQEYSWISLAYAIRLKIDTKQYSEEQVAQIFQMTVREVRQSLEKLTLAEEYLSSRGKEGQYLELEKTEFAFLQLQKARLKVGESSARQKLFSEIAYRLIDTREGDRVYAAIPDALVVLDDIRTALEKEVLGSQIAAKREDIAKPSDQDLFGSPKTQDIEDLAVFQALRESKDPKAVHEVIQNAIDAQKERERAEKRGNTSADAIRAASTALNNAVNALATQASTEGIEAQLKEIDQNLTKIRAWLGKGGNARD